MLFPPQAVYKHLQREDLLEIPALLPLTLAPLDFCSSNDSSGAEVLCPVINGWVQILSVDSAVWTTLGRRIRVVDSGYESGPGTGGTGTEKSTRG